ncbi:uncharacterized protein TNCV_1212591 [Trichonephila clavipes]|nr:uncharacterized protein TNCV_1212591 [Trichonephila clavipes]
MSSPRNSKLGTMCSAVGCSMRSGTNLLSAVKMYRFPTNPSRRLQWEASLQRKNWKANPKSALCNKHFITEIENEPPILKLDTKEVDCQTDLTFRNGKLRFATSDPVCAIQILSLDQLFNISVNASVIWEGITSRFLLYEIPTNVSLEELSAELQDSNNFEIVEIRRFIKSAEKQIMELKCRQHTHVTLSEARRRFRASNSENLSTVLKSKSQENNIQELIDKKFEKMMTAFQTVVEKQTAFLMEIEQKSMETMLSQVCSIVDSITRSSPPGRKKRASDMLKTSISPVQVFSGNSGKPNTELG